MKVKFIAVGRTNPFEQAEFELHEGASLSDLLHTIESQYGSEWLCGLLAVNSEVVYQEQTSSYKLKDGDVVLLGAPISGG
jgi:molybdopterin converting factor small subunit